MCWICFCAAGVGAEYGLVHPFCAGLLGYKLWSGRETESKVLTKIERVNQQIRVCPNPPKSLLSTFLTAPLCKSQA